MLSRVTPNVDGGWYMYLPSATSSLDDWTLLIVCSVRRASDSDDVHIVDDDVEEEDEEPFDPALVPFDELTDEQKAQVCVFVTLGLCHFILSISHEFCQVDM